MSLIREYKHPLNSMNDFFGWEFPNFSGQKNTLSQPRVNIKENEDAFELELAAPGFKKEDFIVDLQSDYLTVKVEQKQEEVKEEKNYKRQEFSYTSFEKRFHLPETVNAENIAAKYQDGILSIVLPKKETEKEKAPQSIVIN